MECTVRQDIHEAGAGWVARQAKQMPQYAAALRRICDAKENIPASNSQQKLDALITIYGSDATVSELEARR